MTDFFDDPDQYEQDEFPDFPYPVNSSPNNPFVAEIFDENGWRTWGDFAADHWGQRFGGDPTAQRSGGFPFLEDAILNLYASGALDWSNFWIDFYGEIKYEVESTP